MKEVDFKIYKKLFEQKSVSKSAISASVLKSDTFKGLINSEILTVSKVGRGLKISVHKKDLFKRFFETNFPEDIEVKTKSDNVRKYRNSKHSKVATESVFMFRGFIDIKINNEIVDMDFFTRKFRLFSSTANSVVCDQICFVENLDTFLNAEKLLGKDLLFIHKYGRIGIDSLSVFKAKKVLVFVDYDFNGLDEYLRIKSVFNQAILFIPENYDDLFEKFSLNLKGNKAKMSERVSHSKDEMVIKIRENVTRNNRFLEQQYWKYD